MELRGLVTMFASIIRKYRKKNYRAVMVCIVFEDGSRKTHSYFEGFEDIIQLQVAANNALTVHMRAQFDKDNQKK